jgi:hypothetical protein
LAHERHRWRLERLPVRGVFAFSLSSSGIRPTADGVAPSVNPKSAIRNPQ